MNLKIFLICFFSLLLTFSCQNKEKNDGRIEIKTGGTNYGKVSLGDYRIASIRIVNSTQSDAPYEVSGIRPPFGVQSVSGQCDNYKVSSKGECIIKVRFAPTQTIEYQNTISILGNQIVLTGKGLKEGEVNFLDSTWNGNIFLAGEVLSKNFRIVNIGDTPASLPRLLGNTFRIIANSCGESVLPGKQCLLSVVGAKTVAQEYDEDIEFYHHDSPIINRVRFTGLARPNIPSGAIEFNAERNEIIADNADEVEITTRPIRDQFGNVVEDGAVVTGTALNLSITSPLITATEGGVARFTVRGTNITGESRLILSSSLSSGVFFMRSISGPPVGEITARPFNSVLRANNTSSLTIETNRMQSFNGNNITDGTPFHVRLIGEGEIVTREFYSVGGSLRVKIKSTTTSGTGVLEILGGVEKDSHGEIISYTARGEFTIDFVPSDEIGDFLISSELESIYTDPVKTKLNSTTNVLVSEIKDEYGNLVGPGKSVNIELSNGVRSSDGRNTFSLVTDINSSAGFTLSGIGVRDWINIYVSVNGKGKTHRVFAKTDNSLEHNKGLNNNIELYMARANSNFNNGQLPPNSASWFRPDIDIFAIRSQDDSNLEFYKSFGYWEKTQGVQRHLIWDCFIPVDSYVMVTPCSEKRVDGSEFTYRSYSMFEIKIEKDTPTIINGNLGALPHSSRGFGGYALGSVSLWDQKASEMIIVGGVLPELKSVVIGGEEVERYSFTPVEKNLKYTAVRLMGHSPLENKNFPDDDLAFPIAPTYHREGNDVYFFGGIKKNTNNSLEYGNILQVYKDGNLKSISISASINGAPVGRYHNGVFYNDSTKEIFIIGGVNNNGTFLDEVWKANLSVENKEWSRVCTLCGLPEFSNKSSHLKIATMDSSPISMKEWRELFESLRSPVLFKDSRTSTKAYLSLPYSPIIGSFNLTTGRINTNDVEDDFLEFKGYGHLLKHKEMDRFYKHDILQPGTTLTELSYKDGKKGEMAYYMAKIRMDQDGASFLDEITPVVSAMSENTTLNNGAPTTNFGVEVLIFNNQANLWEKVGESSLSVRSNLLLSSYNIKRTFNIDPKKYVNSSRDIFLLIKPTDPIGYQIPSGVREGRNRMNINMIRVDGIF